MPTYSGMARGVPSPEAMRRLGMFGLVRAPALDRPGMRWFNVDTPLSLSSLRGRLVILDFWTYCCVNCLHVLPTLARIERTWPEEVVVIGVHSPKFQAERDPLAVAQAIARHGIRHPVVHDPELTLWREYCVGAWPTLVFIAPDGMVIGDLPGEPDPDVVLGGIGMMMKAWKSGGQLRPGVVDRAVSFSEIPVSQLRFPGKIKPLRHDGRSLWAVADSGHHQIVLFDDDGREERRFGRGSPGFLDAGEATSAFDRPQGLICGEGAIFVADTGNHAIRRIDVESGHVMTLGGTGERGGALRHGSPATETALASPWDLELWRGRLLFANAGTHQLGGLDLGSGRVEPLAGTGAEGLEDGPALAAHLAQPSGLALHPSEEILYFVDAESSSVRALQLARGAWVETLVGMGLFDFGRVDGPFEQARFQHPLGITWHEDGLVVADSYNGLLRRLDPRTRTVSRLAVLPLPACRDRCPPLAEPAGVVSAGPGRLLVTDSNNHRLLNVLNHQGITEGWGGM